MTKTTKTKTTRAKATEASDAGTQLVAFRLDADLVAQLDAYAARMTASLPGLTFSRTQAVKVLLAKALASEQVK